MIRVAIADDHAVVREGLKRIIGNEPRLELVGEAADGHSALKMLQAANIDVLILDMSMPGRSGIELINLIKRESPKVAILVLSMHSEEQFAVRAIRAGALGYLSKGCESEELVRAIEKVFAGQPYITATVAERLALEVRRPANQSTEPHSLLSEREFQIFRLLVDGHGIGEIADKLSLNSRTVSTYKARVLEKMQLETTTDLVRYAIRHGLSDLG